MENLSVHYFTPSDITNDRLLRRSASIYRRRTTGIGCD